MAVRKNTEPRRHRSTLRAAVARLRRLFASVFKKSGRLRPTADWLVAGAGCDDGVTARRDRATAGGP